MHCRKLYFKLEYCNDYYFISWPSTTAPAKENFVQQSWNPSSIFYNNLRWLSVGSFITVFLFWCNQCICILYERAVTGGGMLNIPTTIVRNEKKTHTQFTWIVFLCFSLFIFVCYDDNLLEFLKCLSFFFLWAYL